MYFHPWPLLMGLNLVSMSVLAWMGPVVKGASVPHRLDRFLRRFIPLILGTTFVLGAFAAPQDVFPDNVWLHAGLLGAIALNVSLLAGLIRERSQRTRHVSDISPLASHSDD